MVKGKKSLQNKSFNNSTSSVAEPEEKITMEHMRNLFTEMFTEMFKKHEEVIAKILSANQN